MQSTVNTRETDPHDLFVIEPDIVLAARAGKEPSAKAPDVVRQSPDRQIQAGSDAPSGTPAPTVDATFRPTAVSDVRPLGHEASSVGKWAISASMAILLAVVSAVGAAAWQRYGDEAQQMLARFAPRLTLTSATPAAPEPAAPANAPATEPAATEQASNQPAAAEQPSANAAPAAAASSTPAPDSTQLLQSMAHDLANVGQQIGELKASIDQLKASQEQISHEMARISEARVAAAKAAEAKLAEARAAEQRLRQRTLSSRSAVAPIRRPAPVYTPTQAVVAAPPPQVANPPVPLQPLPRPSDQSEDGPVMRPPMPVR